MTNPELARALEVVEYGMNALARGHLPGQHRASAYGSAGKLAGFTSLLHRMDPKNIDPVITRRAFSPVPLVRLYEARVALTVPLLVDLSASMGFVGRARKLAEAARVVTCLSYSAYRLGDRSMLLGFGDEVELHLPPERSPEHALTAGEVLWGYKPTSPGVAGLERASALLPRRRSLVFLISDFHFDRATLERALAGLRPHEVVLVVLWDPAETGEPLSTRWTELYDPETGARTHRWFRPGLASRSRARMRERREMLESTARRFHAETFFVSGRFDPIRLVRFFLARRT